MNTRINLKKKKFNGVIEYTLKMCVKTYQPFTIVALAVIKYFESIVKFKINIRFKLRKSKQNDMENKI